jgi:hypothetical protein
MEGRAERAVQKYCWSVEPPKKGGIQSKETASLFNVAKPSNQRLLKASAWVGRPMS